MNASLTKAATLPFLLIFAPLLTCSGCFPPGTAIRTLAQGSSHNEVIDFQELIEIAERYGLPAPPVEASLVLANTGWTTLVGSSSTSHDPGLYQPAFLLETLPEGRARVLMGWEERIVDSDAEFRPATRPYSLAIPEKKLKGYALAGANLKGFTTAVQLSRRGDLEDAIVRRGWMCVIDDLLIEIRKGMEEKPLGYSGGSPQEEAWLHLNTREGVVAFPVFQNWGRALLEVGRVLRDVKQRAAP